eukprot:2746983-Prymnesium_polylepis.1
MLDQMPDKDGKPNVDTVMQELCRSRDCIPSCFDACKIITDIIGHLARNPDGGPFKGYSDA